MLVEIVWGQHQNIIGFIDLFNCLNSQLLGDDQIRQHLFLNCKRIDLIYLWVARGVAAQFVSAGKMISSSLDLFGTRIYCLFLFGVHRKSPTKWRTVGKIRVTWTRIKITSCQLSTNHAPTLQRQAFPAGKFSDKKYMSYIWDSSSYFDEEWPRMKVT